MNRKSILFVILLTAAAGITQCWAQKATQSGISREAEIVALSGKATFREAMRVIESVSGMRIIAPEDYKDADKEIGFDVPGVQWKVALNIIAKDRGLEIVSRERTIELRKRLEEGGREAAPSPEVLVDSREVSISAIFFEANRSALRELGIDWASLRTGGVKFTFSDTLALKDGRVKSAGVAGGPTGTVDVLTLLRFFESRGQGEVIANPQIRVLSGKEGNVKVGTDFFVTTRDFAGNTIQQLQSTGTILTVTPHVLTQDGVDFIYLLISAERSSYEAGTSTIGKTTASTYALLFNGEETAIGGLYGTSQAVKREGFPFLKDLPWWFFGLKYVFGYDSKQVTKNELVILVKANIVPTLKSRLEEKEKDKSMMEKIEQRRQEFEQRTRRK
ncbi:MAG: type II and III secretion system protein [Candidatus Eisenbacteria bacterium]|nr:type II and III secretion system protein [Candidatus Eisenbacteria bacterium]